MNTDPQSVYQAAMQLAETDRLTLVSRLMDSLPAEDEGLSSDDPDLIAELNRRFAEEQPGIPWSQLKSER